MYSESFVWTQDQLKLAEQQQYAELAFGLKLRTVLLHKTVLGTKSTPQAAEKEARAIGNALGQSWGLLINRAVIELREKYKREGRRKDILPSMLIHDAIYHIVRNDSKTVEYHNKSLQEVITWQEDPKISHPKVKLTGSLDLFYPTWAESFTLPNNASKEQIQQLCKNHVENLQNQSK